MLFSHLKVTIHAQGQAPGSWTLRLFTRGKLLHCQRLRTFRYPEKSEDIGSSRQLDAQNPCARGVTQNRRKLSKTYSQFQRSDPTGKTGWELLKRDKIQGRSWWRRSESNRRPSACKADALPTELRPPIFPIRVVGLGRLELPTSRLSSARSNQLSYRPEG